MSENTENLQTDHAVPNPDIVTDSDYSPPRGHPFPVVGIGGSAGALDAFTRLLRCRRTRTWRLCSSSTWIRIMPANCRRFSPKRPQCAVRNVEDGMAVAPNEVFVIPPNATMILEDGVLRLEPRNPGLHLPVDTFLESLARVQGSRAIGIVLSGNASDGSQGVRAIKGECGLTFAQDEASAQHVGMPRNAIATGAIDFVLPPAEIARELAKLSRHPFLRPPVPERADLETLPDGDGEMRKIIQILRNRMKVDFTHYKPNTIRRRIGRRMIVKRAKTLAQYSQMLELQPDEAGELYRDLLISVTNFFRDPQVFQALQLLLRDLLLSRNPQEPFRVWVPGCATGEEVYSLAICLQEFLQQAELSLSMQIFGTDISEPALQRARQGIYSGTVVEDVSAERLRRFFTKTDSGYQINKIIREACVFARHDVTKDPPFSRIDLVSCRNVLIYLDNNAQRRVLPTFHYALKPTGLLIVGSAETTGAASDLFTPLDKPHHIYARKAVPTRLILDLAAGSPAGDPVASAAPIEPAQGLRSAKEAGAGDSDPVFS